MSTLALVIPLVVAGDIRISAHGFRRLVAHSIKTKDAIVGIGGAEAIEDYPNYHAGPAVLCLQIDSTGAVIHVLSGLERSTMRPVVLITAYRPDPARWSADLRRRLT